MFFLLHICTFSCSYIDKPDENPVELIDGARWRAFWWYKKGSGWPSGLYDVLHGMFDLY